MNIAVLTNNGKVIVRPDTTWERDNEDLYLPDFVNSLSWTPVVFARVSKPGRSVVERFADRYWDGKGFGILLYPDDLLEGGEEGFACASCLDHTSFLTFPTFAPDIPDGEFQLKRNGEEIYCGESSCQEVIKRAVVEVTKYCYIRIGDIIAVELGARQSLCTREDGSCRIEGSFAGSKVLDFKIIF